MPREFSEGDPVDDHPADVVLGCRQCAGVDPPADGVVADTQQLGRLADTKLRHEKHLRAATAASASHPATDVGCLRELMAYWADGFDWPAQEAALSRYPRLRVPLGEHRIHVVHARRGAFPLILTHGWPDSSWRYS